MKHDIKAVDQIQSLEDAKYIIKMMLKTNVDIYNGQGIMRPNVYEEKTNNCFTRV